MKSLKEHNEYVREQYEIKKQSEYATGVECPRCGDELQKIHPHILNCSYPPSISVVCPNCGKRELMYV